MSGPADMFLVSRDDIEEARHALLYVLAAHAHKPLQAEAESRFIDVHRRLGDILKSTPAPELYEALRNIIHCSDDYDESEEADALIRDAVERGRAALAKAPR